MAHFVIITLGEPGHLCPTLRLARGLRERGHQVRYVLRSEDGADWLKERGHEPHVLTSAFANHAAELAASERAFRAKGFRKWRQALPRVRGVIQRSQREFIESGELEALYAELAVDVLLVDVHLPMCSILGVRSKIPVVELCTNYDAGFDLRVPPPNSTRVPRALSAWRNVLEWGLLAWDQSYKWRLRELGLSLESRFEPLRSLKRAAGLRPRSEWAPWGGLGLPQIVFWPDELDLPRGAAGRTRHHDTGLWLCDDCRPIGGDVFPWERVPAQRPLVYAAFGSQVDRYPELPDFLRALLGVAAARPSLGFVLAVGPTVATELAANAPGNALVVGFAPQHELLAEASLFVTHGGAGSVKESVSNGTPMIVVPLAFDQPGAAARVAYHGLGRVVDRSRATAADLGSTIDEMLADAGYAERVRASRDLIAQRHAPEDTYQFVERFVGAG